jgi:predicted RNase H-like nuclease (RuvC/YqgF family)
MIDHDFRDRSDYEEMHREDAMWEKLRERERALEAENAALKDEVADLISGKEYQGMQRTLAEQNAACEAMRTDLAILRGHHHEGCMAEIERLRRELDDARRALRLCIPSLEKDGRPHVVKLAQAELMGCR